MDWSGRLCPLRLAISLCVALSQSVIVFPEAEARVLPFGLVMIEAMACGTPVVAFRRGSVQEVMVDGVTGFVGDGVEGAVAAVGRVASLSRLGCGRVFEERFNAGRMATTTSSFTAA